MRNLISRRLFVGGLMSAGATALLAACEGDVSGISLEFDERRAALTVVMAAAGYPGPPRTGDAITGAYGGSSKFYQ